MNNLFIMHTQYNLILACGIANTRYKNCNNELVLYAEFTLGENLRKNLENSFDKVYYINESFVPPQNPLKEDLYLLKCLKKSKQFLKKSYDNVFLSQERLYDTYILSKLSKSGNFNCYSIEEDVYYSVNNKWNVSPPKAEHKSLLGKIRDAVKTMILGKNKYYQHIYFYGMNSNYNGNYVLFPNSVRKEMKSNNVIEVTENQLKEGISLLYKDVTLDIPDFEQYVLFYFDLTERYKNPNKIAKLVKEILNECVIRNICFLYKYHPRETKGFEFLKESKNAVSIPSNIPGEKVALSLYKKNVLVIGNLTTALWVSKKLGYEVLSVVGIENKENAAAALALSSMGIKVLYDTENINDYLRRCDQI